MKDKMGIFSRTISLLIAVAMSFNVFVGMPVISFAQTPESLIVNIKNNANIEDLIEKLDIEEDAVDILYEDANIIKIDNISGQDYQTIKSSPLVKNCEEDKKFPVQLDATIPTIDTAQKDLKSLAVRDSFDYNKSEQINSNGKNSIVVGIIDTGIHTDYTDYNRFYNTKDLPINGIDDDGNGYIDDVYGYDFVNNNANPMDDNGHGTHVAGILGAVGNNGVGIAGVNWNVRIMPVKMLGANGEGSTAAAINAINYAKRMGADIMSCSWAISAKSQALSDAITQTNALFVAAAGNGGVDKIGDNNDVEPQYPASFGYSNVISVTSVNSADVLSSSANYGQKSVNVASPGVDIWSTYLTSKGSPYLQKSGTSMATPFVSGIAGLMLAVNPSLSPSQLKSLIIQNVDSVSALSTKVSSGGRVNAEKSVIAAGGKPSPTPTLSPTVTPSPTATTSPTASPTLSPTVTPSPTATPTKSPTITPSPTVTPTKSPTKTPIKTLTPIPTRTMRPIPPLPLPWDRFANRPMFPGITR